MSATRRPICGTDIAEATLNIIKKDNVMGKIVEVAGPHEYTLKQLYEIVMNYTERPMKFYNMDNILVKYLMKIKHFSLMNEEMQRQERCHMGS